MYCPADVKPHKCASPPGVCGTPLVNDIREHIIHQLADTCKHLTEQLFVSPLGDTRRCPAQLHVSPS